MPKVYATSVGRWVDLSDVWGEGVRVGRVRLWMTGCGMPGGDVFGGILRRAVVWCQRGCWRVRFQTSTRRRTAGSRVGRSRR